VQTPEFEFEGDLDNVRRAIKEMDVRYPVIVDNDYAVWQAFDNHYWPALYFVDAQGGSGITTSAKASTRSPRWSSRCSCERRVSTSIRASFARAHGVEAAADWASLGSPESYVGYGRAVDFASPGGVVADERHLYSAPAGLRRNQWALSGGWRIGEVPALLTEPGGSITYAFHARDVNLVMGLR
jgi:hypothetical protein